MAKLIPRPRPGAKTKVMLILAGASVPIQVESQDAATAIVLKWKDWQGTTRDLAALLTDDSTYWVPYSSILGILVGGGQTVG